MLLLIRKEIRKKTPVDTGALRRSVKILKNIKRKRKKIIIIVFISSLILDDKR